MQNRFCSNFRNRMSRMIANVTNSIIRFIRCHLVYSIVRRFGTLYNPAVFQEVLRQEGLFNTSTGLIIAVKNLAKFHKREVRSEERGVSAPCSLTPISLTNLGGKNE